MVSTDVSAGSRRNRTEFASWARVVAHGLAVLLLCTACAGVGSPVPGTPAHHRERGFANTNPEFMFPSDWTVNKFRARRLWVALVGSNTVTLPRVANDGRALRENGVEPTVTWVGHATLLIQVDGVNVLTDPHWSERASPVSFAGPRRLVAPGLAFEDLPPIHLVLISHDHYDQLDAPTVRRLAQTHHPLFLVPLGLKAWFAKLGISEVEELDWWQSRHVQGLTLICLPAQHWASRTPWDRNRRLWASWALLGRDRRVFFSGDTGYYEGFKEIGVRLGPATEDSTGKLEALAHGGPCSVGCRIRLAPRSQLFFRPEEVDGRSERVRDFTLVLGSFPEPEHDALGFRPRAVRCSREL